MFTDGDIGKERQRSRSQKSVWSSNKNGVWNANKQMDNEKGGVEAGNKDNNIRLHFGSH